ncbi:hypothetical protein [Labrenzia sp. PHM005]|uniref:hypothetical protein n=1 Tax=Labrenzia sp. PHM005 TaxID=2590016 RepID=UPI0011404AF6|nr:hypothetical protein [Labrenzia sp. PHM005]QDG75095.1 hypothetical protein FJ695_04020 [Labrenzia sp. PHM005]
MALKESLADQQQLALDEKPERALPPTYASYDWTNEGLAERSGENAVVYCYWDQPFGCKIQRQHRDPEDFLPDWPVFEAPDYGRTTGLRSVLAHHPKTLGTGIAAGPGADTALQEFIATLPRILVRLAAPFGNQQWLLMDLFRRAPGLWRKVHQQTALGRLGTLSLMLELFCAAGRIRPQQRQQFANFLDETTRETVLRRYLGRCPEAPILALLEQIPPGSGILERRAIKSALNSKNGSLDLKDLVRLKDEVTEAILSETGWPEKADIRALLGKGLSFARILHTVHFGLRNLTLSERPAALKALRDAKAPQSLNWWSTHWTTIATRSREFPPPPIPAASQLSPLQTGAALEEENRRMRNNIARFLPDILAGDLYFYHWDGHPAATLCLAVSGNGDWTLLDALGEDGTPIHDEALAEIIQAVQAG